MSKALVNRSLTTVKTELEFLLDSGVITQSFHDTVVNSLPAKYQEGMSAVSLSAGSSGARASPSSAPPAAAPADAPPSYSAEEEWVEAMYDYAAQQPEDLPLHVGDRVRVTGKPNPNWSEGVCNGRSGMFPSNYCKPSYAPEKTREASHTPVQQYQPPVQQYQPPPVQQYQPPVQQYQPPAPFPPVSTNYYPQEQVQQAPAPAGGEGMVKKFGKKLGNAAIFGAGATLGGDLVNSIF